VCEREEMFMRDVFVFRRVCHDYDDNERISVESVEAAVVVSDRNEEGR